MKKSIVIFWLVCKVSLADGYWVSSNVATPTRFLTPEEACDWYLDTIGYDLVEVIYRNEKAANCVGQIRIHNPHLRDYGVIGDAGFIGNHWDREKHERDAMPFCMDEKNLNALKQSLSSLFGSQTSDWKIGRKTVRLYAELIKKAQNGCTGLSLITAPLAVPITSLQGLLIHVAKNLFAIWQRQQALREGESPRICLLSSALALKTEFALAQAEGDEAIMSCDSSS